MKKNAGVSLIELLVTVSIISIIIAMATPTYHSYVVKTRVAGVLLFTESVLEQQKAYYGTYGFFGDVSGMANGMQTNGANYWLLNPQNYNPYLTGMVINGYAEGRGLDPFTCSDGTPFGEVTPVIKNPAIGYSGYIVYTILLRAIDNDTVITKCFYRTEFMDAKTAAKYLPPNCQTPATNPGGVNCFLPW